MVCPIESFAMLVFVFFRWRTQLAPILEAWDKLASSISTNSGVGGGSTGRRGSHGRRYSGSAVAAGVEGGRRKLQPVDSFVKMENEAATTLCDIVTASLGAVKKVRWNIWTDALLLCSVGGDHRQGKEGRFPGRSSVSWTIVLFCNDRGCKYHNQGRHQPKLGMRQEH